MQSVSWYVHIWDVVVCRGRHAVVVSQFWYVSVVVHLSLTSRVAHQLKTLNTHHNTQLTQLLFLADHDIIIMVC